MSAEISSLVALLKGDCWIDADACALFLGMIDREGRPNRRAFLERVACRPDFPKRNPVTKSWRKSEVSDWAAEVSRAA